MAFYQSPYKSPYARSADVRVGTPSVDDYYSNGQQQRLRSTYKSTMLLPPGQQVPEGYVVVAQGQDGSAVIKPQEEAGQNPTPEPAPAPTASPSSVVGPVVAGAAIADPELVTSRLPSVSDLTDRANSIISGLGGGSAAELGASQIPSAAAANLGPVGGPSVLAPSDAALSSWGLGEAPFAESAAAPVAGDFGGLVGGEATLGSVGAGAAGAYGMHDLFSRGNTSLGQGALQGAASGAGLGYMIGGPWGAGIGAVAGGLIGVGKSLFGHKLNASEQVQQNIRTGAEKAGIFERPNGSSHAMLKLADGSYYDVESGTGHILDPDMPFGSQLIGWTDPLSVILNGGYGEREGEGRSAFTGYIVNAAYSNAQNIEDARQNILAQYGKLGLTKEQVIQGLTQLKDSGAIDEEFYNALVNSTNSLYDGNPDGYVYDTPREMDPNFGGDAPPSEGEQRPVGPAPLPPGTVNIPDGGEIGAEIARIPSSQPAAAPQSEPPKNLIPKTARIDPIALAKKGYRGMSTNSGRE